MILYLDFDGVLHPREVFVVNGEPELRWPLAPELQLFCWADILDTVLDEHDPAGRVGIVLSTSWGHHFGQQEAASYLPEGLRNRVVGRTIELKAPRGWEIAIHAEEKGIIDWIALDDDVFMWPEEYQHRLVDCDPSLGLSNLATVNKLKALLQ